MAVDLGIGEKVKHNCFRGYFVISNIYLYSNKVDVIDKDNKIQHFDINDIVKLECPTNNIWDANKSDFTYWDIYSISDPYGDIYAISKCIVTARNIDLYMSEETEYILNDHPDIIEKIKYYNGNMASALGVKQIIIDNTLKNDVLGKKEDEEKWKLKNISRRNYN